MGEPNIMELLNRAQERPSVYLPALAQAIRTLLRERENWKETAEQQMRNADFYRGIVCEVGDLFGDAAKTADDGTIMEDVLALVVPGLVEKLLRERDELQTKLNDLLMDLCAAEVRYSGGSLWGMSGGMLEFISAHVMPEQRVMLTFKCHDHPDHIYRIMVAEHVGL